MVSRENKILVVCATTGLLLAYGGRAVTPFDDSVFIAVLLVVGVVLPQLLNNYLDDRATE